MSSHQTAFALLAIIAIAAPEAALAHAHLKSAVPSVGATTHAPPSDVTLMFSEGVEPRFSGIVLTDGAGKTVPTGQPANAPGKREVLIVPINATLTPGAFTVTWHAVALDTHKTQGTFIFTVAP